MSKNIKCRKCGRRFKDEHGANSHIADKHGGNSSHFNIADATGADDESFASRAIQAEIDIASGLGSDDEWLLP